MVKRLPHCNWPHLVPTRQHPVSGVARSGQLGILRNHRGITLKGQKVKIMKDTVVISER